MDQIKNPIDALTKQSLFQKLQAIYLSLFLALGSFPHDPQPKQLEAKQDELTRTKPQNKSPQSWLHPSNFLKTIKQTNTFSK